MVIRMCAGRRDGLDNHRQQHVQIHRHRVFLDPPDPRVLQHAVDEAVHAVHAVLQQGDLFLGLGAEFLAVVLAQPLGNQSDAAQRGPQIMGHDVGKVRQLLVDVGHLTQQRGLRLFRTVPRLGLLLEFPGEPPVLLLEPLILTFEHDGFLVARAR